MTIGSTWPPLPEAEEWTAQERLGYVANALGIYEFFKDGDLKLGDWISDNWDGDAFANLSIGPNNWIYFDGPPAV